MIEDVKPLDIPFDTKGGAEQLHSINATQSWHTLDNVTIPHEQATILSPSVGGKLELAKHVIPMQVPAAGEVLVKVGWTGVCGSVSRMLFIVF
jgi:propanol-preferring alcohol dehydrogenase